MITILQKINIAQITILQLLFNKSNQIKRSFLMRGETGIPAEKLQSRVENQLTQPHMTLSTEIESGPHW